jgi:predicted O-methyltransferase YrrM
MENTMMTEKPGAGAAGTIPAAPGDSPERGAISSHKDTFTELSELGDRYPGYKPTFRFAGKYIDRDHGQFEDCPVKDGILVQLKTERWSGPPIEGWLLREDAMKLYEMAYFASGDILELGSFHGLSTTVLSLANRNSGGRKHVYSVDIDCSCVAAAGKNLRGNGLCENVSLICTDAAGAVNKFAEQGKQFGFAFIDHHHSYKAVYDVCVQLHKVVKKGGFCLFHDYNNPQNRDAADKDYGVYQAVRDGLSPAHFEFYGIYGCTALYRAVSI